MFQISSVCLLISMVLLANAARLDTNYLPPHAGSGGGNPGGNSGAVPSFNSGGGGGYSGGNRIPILRYDNSNNGDGTYRYSYETGNGIQAEESGAPRAPGVEGPAVTSQGSYSYTAPDGQRISVSYTADENGFHPTGSHLPTPPPIPEAILKSIQLNSQQASNDDGSYRGGNSGNFNAGGNGGSGGYHY